MRSIIFWKAQILVWQSLQAGTLVFLTADWVLTIMSSFVPLHIPHPLAAIIENERWQKEAKCIVGEGEAGPRSQPRWMLMLWNPPRNGLMIFQNRYTAWKHISKTCWMDVSWAVTWFIFLGAEQEDKTWIQNCNQTDLYIWYKSDTLQIFTLVTKECSPLW